MQKRPRALHLLLALTLLAGGALRFTGLLWDEGQHLNPDERFLAMVVASTRLPASFPEYLDTARSPLNPHNAGHSFFVYGTLPLFLGKTTATLLGRADYGPFLPWGRALAAAADFGTLLLVAWCGMRLGGAALSLLASVFYAFAPLTLQHAHFFVVDPFLSFLVLAGLLLAWKRRGLGFGAVYGLALATKLTAAPLCLALPLSFFLGKERVRAREAALRLAGAAFAAFLTFRLIQPYAFEGPGFFGLAPNPRWLENLRELSGYSSLGASFPPSLQWQDRNALFAPIQFAVFGFGLPAALAAAFGIAFRARGNPALSLLALWTLAFGAWQSLLPNPTLRYLLPVYGPAALLAGAALLRAPRLALAASLASVAMGLSFASAHHLPHTRLQATRFLYREAPQPVRIEPALLSFALGEERDVSTTTPFFADFEKMGSRIAIERVRFARIERLSPGRASFALTVLGPDGMESWKGSVPAPTDPVFPLVFRMNPREIKGHIRIELRVEGDASARFRITRVGIARESIWDDALPLQDPGLPPVSQLYSTDLDLGLFEPDSPEKGARIERVLARAEWIVSSSQRVWGSVGRLPELYPLTNRFYRDLGGCREDESVPACYRALARGEAREGRLGFRLERRFASPLPDLLAEEAFSVYDRPPVLIFRKVTSPTAPREPPRR